MNKIHCTIPAHDNVDDYYSRHIWEHQTPVTALSRRNAKSPNSVLRPDDLAYIKLLHDNGATQQQIADEVGLTSAHVAGHIAKLVSK